MQAIISDIHGNLEALEAVLADIEACGATSIYCLGNLVGYGPDPIPCVELAMEWDLVLQGKFDLAALSDDDLSNWSALAAKRTVFNFRRQLQKNTNRAAIRDFLTSRKEVHSEIGIHYLIGMPTNPVHGYFAPQMIDHEEKMNQNVEAFEQICFCGHTGHPGVFFFTSSNVWNFATPEECENRHRVGDSKVICNVGSVGRPRDGIPKACYVLFDGETITFRRVKYDIEKTIAKILDDDDFDNFLAEALREGR